MVRSNIILFIIAVLFLTVLQEAVHAYPTGITGRTLKTTTSGCSCHGSRATGVNVVISGPSSVVQGQTASFTLKITGGSAAGSGCNIATKTGSLNPVSTFLQLMNGELTQNSTSSMTYDFTYKAPTTGTSDTIYATGLSIDGDGSTSGDSWNWAPNIGIAIVAPPPSPPASPTLASPLNNATGQATTLTLSWNASTGASAYRVQVSVNSTFSTFVVNDSTLTTTSRSVSGLSNSATYYWRVNAKNAGGTSAFSSVWSLTTGASLPPAPIAPVLVSPIDTATDQATMLTLSWNASTGASTYRVQVSVNSTFSTFVVNDSTLTTTSRSVSGLSNSTTYYWRVNAKNAGGTSAFSSVWSFSTMAPIQTGATILISPVNNAVVRPRLVSLRWNSGGHDITRYWIEISTNSSFSNPVIDSIQTDTVKLLRHLRTNTSYWWRVRAFNSAGWGTFSDTWVFNIRKPVASDNDSYQNEAENIIPDGRDMAVLYQNYPNPFNPSTSIPYYLPDDAHITVSVFNTLGQRLAVLFQGNQTAGSHFVNWSADVAAGLYFYRIEGQNLLDPELRFGEIRKMLYIK